MNATLTLSLVLLLFVGGKPWAAESVPVPVFFRPNDVVALIGGEDIVALAESGQLEAQIVRQPGLAGVKFRALAYEGDTVFEQHRQLNYPTWEEQLAKIGATVVIVRFGQMETLRPGSDLDEFIAHYEALLKRLAGGNRRVVLLSPTPFEKPLAPQPDRTPSNALIDEQLSRIVPLADKLGAGFVDLYRAFSEGGSFTRDGIHLNDRGQWTVVREIIRRLGMKPLAAEDPVLLALLTEKNRLWFNYHRPQNWAFLNGDRTEQLFSRDYRDTSVRLLPREMEAYGALIEAKERAIIAHLNGVQVEKN